MFQFPSIQLGIINYHYSHIEKAHLICSTSTVSLCILVMLHSNDQLLKFHKRFQHFLAGVLIDLSERIMSISYLSKTLHPG